MEDGARRIKFYFNSDKGHFVEVDVFSKSEGDIQDFSLERQQKQFVILPPATLVCTPPVGEVRQWRSKSYNELVSINT